MKQIVVIEDAWRTLHLDKRSAVFVMATSFDEVRRRNKQLAQKAASATGVTESLAMNVIVYAKALTTPQQPHYVEKFVFMAQMWYRFGMTCRFLIKTIYESLRSDEYAAVSLEKYVHLVCVFLTADITPKIDYVFRCYDLKKDGHLDYTEIHSLLRSTVNTKSDDFDNQDHIGELIELVLIKMDRNRDQIITFEEFEFFVRQNVLYIELLGSVLPLDINVREFLLLIEDKTPATVSNFFFDEKRLCLNQPYLKKPEDPLYPIELETPI